MDNDRYNMTREKVFEMLYEDRALAHKEGKINAAISVAKLFGDAIGMFKQPDAPITNVNFLRVFTESDKNLLTALAASEAKLIKNNEE